MKNYVKLTVCGLAAAMLIAGCAKKEETAATTAAAESTAAAGETTAAGETAAETIVDNGEITKLGQYKGVEVTKMSTEVTDEEVEARIQTTVAKNPNEEEITDRGAQVGDTVNIDYVGMKDGVAFEGGTASAVNLKLGSNQFIDGFEDGLVGARAGDEVSLNLTFPENYQSEELAGQDVVFDVTVNKVKVITDAVFDDAFVQRISDFKTMDEFRADTRTQMEIEKEAEAQQKIESDAFMAAIENSEYELNQAAVDEQYEQQMNYYNSMAQMNGMTLDTYIILTGSTKEKFDEDLHKTAEQAVKEQLLVPAIAEKEGMVVEDADRELVAKLYGMDVKKLQEAFGAENVDKTAMIFKVVGFIKENAVVK